MCGVSASGVFEIGIPPRGAVPVSDRGASCRTPHPSEAIFQDQRDSVPEALSAVVEGESLTVGPGDFQGAADDLFAVKLEDSGVSSPMSPLSSLGSQ